LYRRLGGPQGRSGRVRKISPPTGIRSPDRPARSESLYRPTTAGNAHLNVVHNFRVQYISIYPDADYSDRLGPSGKHFRTVIVLWLKFSPICQTRIRNYVVMFYLYVNKYVAQNSSL